MKATIKDFLTKEDIEQLPSGKWQRIVAYKDHPIISKILSQINEYTLENWGVEYDLHELSYFSTERRPEGHIWHVDTGSRNHMPWCRLGVTILLTEDFTGGEIYYREEGKISYFGTRKAGTLYMHTSDVEHMVKPHEGNRTVFLLFI